MKQVSFSVFALSLSVASNAAVVGSAYDLKTGELIYTETHAYDAPYHTVEYHDPKGALFATKLLDYRDSSHAPAFEQINQLRGEVIRTQVDGSTLTLSYQASSDTKVDNATFPITNNLIVDAGFDQYVKANWQQLSEGKPLEIDYLVPSRASVVPFSVGAVDCLARTPAQARCFAITPEAWWLRMIVDPIIIAYDDTPRLLRFTGRGNIANQDGAYQSVDIFYQYEEN